MKIDKKFLFIYIILGLALFSVFLIYIWNFTVDDAYISFRYAQHLAQGQGLVWNVGEPPVEGFSNFLWVLMIAGFDILNLNPILAAKFLSLVSLFIIIILYWKTSEWVFQKQRKLSYMGFGIGFLLLLVNPATALHSVSGLETMAYSAGILGLVYSGYKIKISGKNLYYSSIVIFAILSSLLRPEGILICVGLFLFIIFYTRKDKEVLHSSFKSFAAYLVLITSFLVFRIYYFNDILPLTFYVKTVAGGGLWNGVHLFSQVFGYIIPFIAIICIAVFLNLRSTLKFRNKTFLPLILISVVAMFLASAPYIYSASLINYGQRILYPSLVILYIISGISLTIIFNEIRIKILNKLPSLKYSRIFETVVVVLLVSSNMIFISDLTGFHSYEDRIEVAHIALGKSLTPFAGDNYTIASVDAGTMPYFSEWKHLDIYSLNDKFIVKNGIATKDYVEKKDPELVIIVSTNGESMISRFNAQKPFIEFVQEKNYVRLPPIKYSDNYYLVPFINPHIKDFNEISTTLQIVSMNSMD